MNKKYIVAGVIMLVFLLPIARLFAIEETDSEPYCITEKAEKKLSPEADAYYKKGTDALDHIDQDTAIECFEKALSINPENVDLQFAYTKLASRRARVKYGDDSTKLYRKVIAAFDEIIKNPRATKDQISRAKKQKDIIEKELSKVAERDERRKEVGIVIIKEKIKEKTQGTESESETGGKSSTQSGAETYAGANASVKVGSK